MQGCGFDPGSNIPHASHLAMKNTNQKQYCNKFSKDIKKCSNLLKKNGSVIWPISIYSNCKFFFFLNLGIN